ncbi:MAG: exo-alpha-sialidase [Bacteroidaceae bacterium]|nr:exo-alpha-sialidase [Bacteroidaceae bacterium]
MKHLVHTTLGSLLLLVAATCSLTAAASVPFVTTQLEGGAFSDTTTWYTMTIDNSGLVIANPGSADRISLDSKLAAADDANLWCFVGNETDGFLIYNKAAGTSVVLSSPSTLSGATGVHATEYGGNNYVVLKAPGTSGYVNLWLFAASTDLDGVDGYYMYQKGRTAAKVNNRDGVLAFWTNGQDHGSTLAIEFAKKRLPVNLTTGSFTSSNAVGTYHSTWTATMTAPGLTLSHAKNNIDLPVSGDNTKWRMSANNDQNFTFTTTAGYIVSAVGLTFYNNNSSTDMTVACGGQSTTASGSATATLTATGLTEQTAVITLSPSGSNAIVASGIWVVLERNFGDVEPSVELFKTASGAIPYRIPAIAVAYNGDVIAISDYRYCKADIGNGRIDLHQRTSHDNGATWDATRVIAQGDGVMNSAGRNYSLTAGYGDACIVADRESPRVLLMSVCGYQTFPNATRDVPNQVARWYSNDNGATWTGPEVITEMFYAPFDEGTVRGPIRSMFIGSGKIHQSRYVKVGQYYRLYCSTLTKDVNGTNVNYVLYSDDFGQTWNILGSMNEPPIPNGGDEPKAEELPDGSVLCSSRATGGRYYNIFTFTDLEKAEGSWGTSAFSGSGNNGVTALSNSCNGEILIVPARRNRDGAQVYLALQSLPFGSGRTNVGIYYKELTSYGSDFATADLFAANWDGRHQASVLGSAYSTMAVQHDGNIGFLYEESTYSADYTIVYKNYSLEQITNDAYTLLAPEEVSAATVQSLLREEIADKVRDLQPGTAVGQLDSEAIAALRAQATASTGTVADVVAINRALAEAPGVKIEPGRWYRLRNVNYPTLYLNPSTSSATYTGATLSKTNYAQLFTFEADGDYYRIKAANLETYLGPGQAANTALPQTDLEGSGLYAVTPHTDGHTQLACLNPVSTYTAPHLNSGGTLVTWNLTATASQWYIELADEIQVTVPSGGYASKIFSFPVTLPEGFTAYAVTGVEETEGDTAYAVLTVIPQPVPARTPFIAAGTRGSALFGIGVTDATVEGNLLEGNLTVAAVTGDNVYGFRSTNPVGYTKRNTSNGNIAANTAYMRYDGDVRFIRIDPDHTTGIATLSVADTADAPVYDLQGRRVANPTHGVYIVGGKKVFVK